MSEERIVSRRESFKLAGVAGATIGVAGGLVGLVAACGGDEETTTTAGADYHRRSHHHGGGGNHHHRGCDHDRFGLRGGRQGDQGRHPWCPRTGPLAAFAGPFDWVHEQWTRSAEGVVCGDGKSHPIKTYVEDTQSDTNRCAQVTGDLIQNTKADVIFAGGAPDTMNPAADVCEAMGTPAR